MSSHVEMIKNSCSDKEVLLQENRKKLLSILLKVKLFKMIYFDKQKSNITFVKLQQCFMWHTNKVFNENKHSAEYTVSSPPFLNIIMKNCYFYKNINYLKTNNAYRWCISNV